MLPLGACGAEPAQDIRRLHHGVHKKYLICDRELVRLTNIDFTRNFNYTIDGSGASDDPAEFASV